MSIMPSQPLSSGQGWNWCGCQNSYGKLLGRKKGLSSLIAFDDSRYIMQLCWSRSSAETSYVRNSIKYEFRFGEQYARIMMMFCMTIMYSVSCPLITPFGTLYFVTKHYVDRHNLMYAYKPSKINKKVHATAIGFVILG